MTANSDNSVKSTKYKLDEDAVFESFSDGGLVLRLSDCNLFELNQTSTFILSNTDGNQTVGDVVVKMVHEFEIAENDALKDVLEFYRQMSIEKLLVNSISEGKME
jgi:hypothetical protein